MVTREEIIESAMALIGVPWEHQGRNPDIGLDCLGVLSAVAMVRGTIDAPLPTGYGRLPDGTFLKKFREYGLKEIHVPYQKDGDIVVFGYQGDHWHCGIYLLHRGVPSVIHGHAGIGKVCLQKLKDAESYKRIGRATNAFQFPGVE